MIELNNTVEVTDELLPNGAIRTYTGRAFEPLNPDPNAIVIEDIAHALANNCRFTGHVKWHYSVAQHSILVSEIVPNELALTGLLHDASEAYLSDVARPIKQQPEFGDVYLRYEKGIEEAIAERFGIVYPYPDEVKEADNLLLVTEARDLMYGTKGWTPALQEIEPLQNMNIERLTPDEAEELFLDRYRKLEVALS